MTAQWDPAHYAVLIPSYKPDERLVTLVRTLRRSGLNVLVIDDGNGPEFQDFFTRSEELGAQVEHHDQNRGKGRGIKTGLSAIAEKWPEVQGVITADDDGQHTPVDVLRLVDAMHDSPGALVLGVRDFVGDVPFKSRAGNAITRVVYRLVTGIAITDTQTGLRGIPAGSIPQMLTIEGDRYEYEMDMLLKIREFRLPVVQVPIQTVYIDQNASSHFHPLRDAARIYYTILRFAFSSLLSTAIDLGLFALLLPFWGELFSYYAARIVSSIVNFVLNKKAVFKDTGTSWQPLLRYYILVVIQMLIGAGLTKLLSGVTNFNPLLIKIPVDIALFFVNYQVQRRWVFKKNRPVEEETAA